MLEIRPISIETITCLFVMFSLWSAESMRCPRFELLRHRFQMYPDKASTRIHLAGAFKFIHSGERFQIYPFSMGENAVYVWTEPDNKRH